MKFKEIEHGYADIKEKYLIYEDDEKWNVYKNKGHNAIEFIWRFNTLEEAKEFVESKVKYPEYESDCARVIVTTKDGRKRKAMFYWNGSKPTFASYGTDISEIVIDWEYRD